MTFLHPLLLGAGLACVSIPILIHFLMRRRRKPVRWAAMRFVIEAYRRQRRRMRLEQLLLLAARCLLIALIAFALGRPVLSRAGLLGSGTRDVYLLIDNSLASATIGPDGSTALASSVIEARRVLAQLDGAGGDRAALVLLGGPAQADVLPPTTDLALVERRLAELAPTDGGMDLAGGVALISPFLTEPLESVDASVCVLSAFRSGSVGDAVPLSPLGGDAALLASPPAEAPLGNTGIDSVTLLRPVVLASSGDQSLPESVQIRVGLTRSGIDLDGSGVSSVRVTPGTGLGVPSIGEATVRWAAGQETAETIVDVDLSTLERGEAMVLFTSIADDANARDNGAWSVLLVRDKLRAAIIGTRRFGQLARIESFEPSDWLSLALNPSTDGMASAVSTEVLDAATIDSGSLTGFDAVLVAEPDRLSTEAWDAIGQFNRTGGAVLLSPASAAGAQLWGELAVRELDLPWTIAREPVELEDEGIVAVPPDGDDPLWFLRGELADLVAGVGVTRVLPVETGGSGQVLLSTEAEPVLILSAGQPGTGRVMYLAAAPTLAWTNLPARPLMVPLMQELVRSAAGASAAAAVGFADGRVAAPVGAVELRPLADAAADSSVYGVDPSTGRLRRPVRSRGVFEAIDARGVATGTVAVSAVASAGDVGRETEDRVERWLASIGQVDAGFAWLTEGWENAEDAEAVRPAGGGGGLALLLGALALACLELGLARWVSHASVVGRSGA